MDRNVKNNDVAATLRSEGNELYKNSQFYDALVKYNQCLCVAVVGSEEMGLAYGNRSAIYFEIKLYDKAVSNIRRALKNGYPKEKMERLLKREKIAKELKKTMTKDEKDNVIDEIFKLSYKPNLKYPSFSECIEMRENDGFGRYLITNRDLQPGDVIAIEDFFYYGVHGLSRCGTDTPDELINYQICNFCLEDNLLDLFPCENCAYTMYCSPGCRGKSMARGHFLECDFVHHFIEKPSIAFPFQSFFTAMALCKNSIIELRKIIGDVRNPEKLSVFDLDFSTLPDDEHNKKLIQVMFSAQSTITDSDDLDIIYIVKELLLQSDKTAEMYNENKLFVSQYILNLFLKSKVNQFQIGHTIPNKKLPMDKSKVSAGDSMCPGLTLLNHSCNPNVKRIDLHKKFALIVIRKIKAGEQLFDCYALDYGLAKRSDRQGKMFPYGFQCDCDACENNYPTLMENSEEGQFYDLAKSYVFEFDDENSAAMTLSRAKTLLKECSDILKEAFEPDAISLDFSLIQGVLINCYNFIANYGEMIP